MVVQQPLMNEFLSMSSTSFAIPVYQRNYAWEQEQCEKLLEDIISISDEDSQVKGKKHFMGTITYIMHQIPIENSPAFKNEYVIIDGQQRITTMMLLLKALETKMEGKSSRLSISRIISEDDENNRLRLKPIKRDREAFECVMRGE